MTSFFTQSATTTNISVFDPKYKCDCNTHHHVESMSWVRASCNGGWQIKHDWGGRPEVWLSSESDYMMYLLKWS